jgi:hypothetical protein
MFLMSFVQGQEQLGAVLSGELDDTDVIRATRLILTLGLWDGRVNCGS